MPTICPTAASKAIYWISNLMSKSIQVNFKHFEVSIGPKHQMIQIEGSFFFFFLVVIQASIKTLELSKTYEALPSAAKGSLFILKYRKVI